MKKTILSALLFFGYSNGITAEFKPYYVFTMHATCSTKEDVEWKKSIDFIESLSQYCENAGDDAEAFSNRIAASISTIKNIFTLCKNKSNVSISMNVFGEPITIPTEGLIIALEFSPDLEKENYFKNCNEINSLMTSIETSCNQKNIEEALENLKNLELVFELMSGESEIHVKHFE